MKSLSVFVVAIVGLCIAFPSTSKAFEQLSIKRVDREVSPTEIVGSGLSGVYRLQRSFDLTTWEDLFLVVSELNDVPFADPASNEQKNIFYRLYRASSLISGKRCGDLSQLGFDFTNGFFAQ